MDRFQPRNWTESRWEKEIRRDERRICGYFSALLEHLDKPDEEALIIRTLAAKPELLSEDNENVLHCWSYLAPDQEDEDEDASGDGESRPASVFSSGELIIDMLDDLACQWNEYYISSFPAHLLPWGVCAACFYGRLLARVADFADACASSESDPELRTTLAKFVLSDAKILEETLKFIAAYHPGIETLIQKHIKKLPSVCEWAVHLLAWTKERCALPPDSAEF